MLKEIIGDGQQDRTELSRLSSNQNAALNCFYVEILVPVIELINSVIFGEKRQHFI